MRLTVGTVRPSLAAIFEGVAQASARSGKFAPRKIVEMQAIKIWRQRRSAFVQAAEALVRPPRSHDNNLFLIKLSYLGRMAAVHSDRRRAPRTDDPDLRGRRREPRAYILLPASVEALSGHNRVELLDVSRTGARLEGADLPAVGKDIVLRCDAIDTFGTVVWTACGRCGVYFDEPISGQDLIVLRAVAVAAERSGITSEELQATADWANGLAR